MDVGVGQEGMRAVGVGLGRKIKSAMPKRPTPRRPASPRDRRVIDVSAHDDSSIFFFFLFLRLILISSGLCLGLKSSVDKRGRLGTLGKEPRPNF